MSPSLSWAPREAECVTTVLPWQGIRPIYPTKAMNANFGSVRVRGKLCFLPRHRKLPKHEGCVLPGKSSK